MSSGDVLKVALVHEVFAGPNRAEGLRRRLEQARRAGARLAVLPELPLDRWVPATRQVREEDAEPPEGPRHQALSESAREAGIGLLGGAITRDPDSGRRFNRALLFDARGTLVGTYDKLHVPGEEGFWESDHYDQGDAPPHPIDAFGLPLGLQICSDLQRVQGTQLLGARGAAAVLAPRATPPESYERWRTVIRANAVTAAVYLVSVNRPASEGAASIGGPSLVVHPSGEVLAESTGPLCVVELEQAAVEQARADYPGYLDVRADLYARAWADLVS